MMDFWTLIDNARGGAAAPSHLGRLVGQRPDKAKRGSADPDRLRELLDGLPTEQIAQFAEEFKAHHQALATLSLWGAGYVIAGGMSDDGFHYFRSWIIGSGREVYELALHDPDALGPYIDDPEEVENEELGYVTVALLEKRGESDPGERSTSEEGPTGEPFDEETVEGLYPRLAAQFGEEA